MCETEKKSDAKEYPAHWLEGIVQKILERKPKEIALSTGKTPSGHIHLGIMRELLICDALRRIFEQKGFKVNYRLFFDSLDAAKRFPEYVPKEYAKENLGKPFALIPNPFEKDNKNFAQVFGEELASTFKEFGIKVDIVWTHELYRTKEIQEKIRIGLIKNDLVKEIVAKYLTESMPEDKKEDYIEEQKTWMGAMVVCEKCSRTQQKNQDGTISPNRVLAYNSASDMATYHCPACGYDGKVSVASGLLKLNWRLDWPAKWSLFNTTCEPAGKDHCTPGGSYDTGLDLSKVIYNFEGPVKVAYEWLRLGDNDMKTSKGIVFTPIRFLEIAEPEILRMIIYQTNPNKHISIRIEELEQYINEYDRLEKIHFGLEKANSDEEAHEIQYMYPFFHPNEVPSKYQRRIPFKMLMILAQLRPIFGDQGVYEKVQEYMAHEKFEESIPKPALIQSLDRIQNWIEEVQNMIKQEKNQEIVRKLSQKIIVFSVPKELTEAIRKQLDESDKQALSLFLEKIQAQKTLTEDMIKEFMQEIQTKLNLKPAKLFQGFYLILLGEKGGPRLGPLLTMLDKKWVEARIQFAIK